MVKKLFRISNFSLFFIALIFGNCPQVFAMGGRSYSQLANKAKFIGRAFSANTAGRRFLRDLGAGLFKNTVEDENDTNSIHSPRHLHPNSLLLSSIRSPRVGRLGFMYKAPALTDENHQTLF